jgi:thiol-disulfide isomerase/thioredoxin
MTQPSSNPWMQKPGILFGVCLLFVCAVVLIVVWPRNRVTDVQQQHSNNNLNIALTNAAAAAGNIDDVLPDTTLPDLSGAPVSIAAESDRVVTVVALWNTRCEACITEVLALQSLVTKYANRVSFIALDRGDTPSVAQTAVTEHAIESRVLVDQSGGQAVLSGDAAISTLYLARNHVIVGVGIGPLTTDQIELKITQLLGGA